MTHFQKVKQLIFFFPVVPGERILNFPEVLAASNTNVNICRNATEFVLLFVGSTLFRGPRYTGSTSGFLDHASLLSCPVLSTIPRNFSPHAFGPQFPHS